MNLNFAKWICVPIAVGLGLLVSDGVLRGANLHPGIFTVFISLLIFIGSMSVWNLAVETIRGPKRRQLLYKADPPKSLVDDSYQLSTQVVRMAREIGIEVTVSELVAHPAERGLDMRDEPVLIIWTADMEDQFLLSRVTENSEVVEFGCTWDWIGFPEGWRQFRRSNIARAIYVSDLPELWSLLDADLERVHATTVVRQEEAAPWM